MTLARLDPLLARNRRASASSSSATSCTRARDGTPRTLRAIDEWRAAHSSIEMLLVRGNHDTRAGDPPESLQIACVDGPALEGPFALAHHPARVAGRVRARGARAPWRAPLRRGSRARAAAVLLVWTRLRRAPGVRRVHGTRGCGCGGWRSRVGHDRRRSDRGARLCFVGVTSPELTPECRRWPRARR